MCAKGASTQRIRARVAVGAGVVILVMIAIVLVLGLGMKTRATTPAPSPQGAASQAEQATTDDGFPVVDWMYWQSVNSDIVGWVSVPGTDISQPIVQAPASDPTYYLRHDVYCDYNIYGCPYLDADCADTGLLASSNAVVFGHNMDDGSMFSAFSSYSDNAFAEAHATVLMQTPTEKRTLNVRGADVIGGWESTKRTKFLDAADWRAWWTSSIEDADVVLDASEPNPQNIVTFVTCSYNYRSNERTLVYAVPDSLARRDRSTIESTLSK